MGLNYENTLMPKDLREYDGPLFVKNEVSTIISFDDQDNNKYLRLNPNGRDGDFSALDRVIAQNIGFQKLWRRGDVSIFPDGAADQELTDMELRTKAARQRKAEQDSAELAASPIGSTDISTETCVECGREVFRTQAEIKENATPPLCETHEDNALDWSLSVTEAPDGTNLEVWKPAKVGN